LERCRESARPMSQKRPSRDPINGQVRCLSLGDRESMPITPQQIAAAQQAQHTAAQDPNPRVRLVAGPGTGKSSSIEERVRWLLSTGVQPERIAVVSFTRAAATDLRGRVHGYCVANGQPSGEAVKVTTLHSLALRVLRATGLLAGYPADPMVMDQWELGEIFDAEFSSQTGWTPTRCGQIRREREAFWSTGNWAPPTYTPPNPPISQAERNRLSQFQPPRTQTYSAVLPGEMVRRCVEATDAGVLDPAQVLDIAQLIVDEFQDLNPCDQDFVDRLIQRGVVTFIAGDDDQSIYSFRFASPQGIQNFPAQYPPVAAHALSDCFRCTPVVVAAATAVVTAHPLPNRIPKVLNSLYGASMPPINGFVGRWSFGTSAEEAVAIAESCRDLIAAGVPPREIIVLLSNSDLLGRRISEALAASGVPHQSQSKALADEEWGRLVLSVCRIICSGTDYVAHRAVLGLMSGVGIGTCNSIADKVVANNLNYRNLFTQPLPNGVFNGRETKGIDATRTALGVTAQWLPLDTLGQRRADLETLVGGILGTAASAQWTASIAQLPDAMNLEELRDYLWADTDDQRAEVMIDMARRLGQAPTPEEAIPQRVRLMTMHGAKGLSARVVFIPGLEEQVLPGPWRAPYPGLVLEAARLLYVSISRARAACIMSYARRRWIYGRGKTHAPSRFTMCVGGPFAARAGVGGVTAAECASIAADCGAL
jgi:DNA helicase II / ATP-dependent DNA helicase PcrA